MFKYNTTFAKIYISFDVDQNTLPTMMLFVNSYVHVREVLKFFNLS